jgi:hypothetical protein
MKLFKDSRGHILSFGFDMNARIPDKRMICWCDPNTMSWEPTLDNTAGYASLDIDVAPEFIVETRNRTIVAYQAGKCIEGTYAGLPYHWVFRVLEPTADAQDASEVEEKSS